MKKEYTTLSVEIDLKSKLEKQMFKIGQRLTYSEIIEYLIQFHNDNYQLIDNLKNNNNDVHIN